MFHPFNLPSINDGKDLIDFFYKAAEFLSNPREEIIPSDSSSLKVDGANTAFKLVRGPSGLEFALDRGTMFPIDIEGITIDRLTERWAATHGMVAMGKIQLGALNRALPKIKKELIALGMLDKKGNPDTTKFINTEFCWKETNAVKYEEDFIALHGLNQYYEKDYRGVHRPGAVRPLERDEKSGQMKPVKAAGTEIPYDEQAMESLRQKLIPFFRDAVGPKNPEGFNVYTVIPVNIKEGSDLASRVSEKLQEPLSIQIKASNLSEWNTEGSNGVATMSLESWLSDSRTVNPRGHFIKTASGEKKAAMSKEIYGRILNGEPVESIVADPQGWDVPMAINGALFYYAIENVGATILEQLTSPLGDMVTDEMAHEGVVLRNEELFGVKMVKLTGNFITAGAAGNFAKAARSPSQEEGNPEQGDVVQPDEVETDNAPLNIALIPGAFKPPHKGHLYMVKRFAKINAIDKVIIIISNPLKSSRSLPKSKKVITAEDSKLIWDQYIAGSGVNAEAYVSKAASPVQVVYDYVMSEDQPSNDLVAPLNSVVYMGCGDKEEDASRFDDIVKKARKDLKIKIVTCPLGEDNKHSPQYRQMLQASPDIMKSIPSVASGKQFMDFHASDMRHVAELAEESVLGLQLFQDFVPPGDALAVLGILGINAADTSGPRSEEDQVDEPELPVSEVFLRGMKYLLQDIESSRLSQEVRALLEGDSTFQKRVKEKLPAAWEFLLGHGRQDMLKHSGGFNQRRPKIKSNALKAEDKGPRKTLIGVLDGAGQVHDPENNEELEELSAMGAGMIALGTSKKTPGKRDEKTTGVKKMKTSKKEKKLRSEIRKSLLKFIKFKNEEHFSKISSVLEEHKLRMVLRDLILEAGAEDPTVDLHDNTGINTLKDLLKNTNILSTLREVYKTLTTDENQRKSFRSHVIKWVQDTLAPVKINDVAPELHKVNEDIDDGKVDIDVRTAEEDAEKLIDADDGEDNTPEEDKDNPMQALDGEDTTGRNKAERVYPTIEKSIVDFYGELDNAEDQELFYDYLIANLKLYFDKWESEMSTSVEEPTNDEYQAAASAAE